jgi:hypothetical protein
MMVAVRTQVLATWRSSRHKPGEAEVTALIGRPTGRYPGPDSQARIEFATGPYERVTWMVDLDASGKVIDAPKQVLNEAHFSWIQQNASDRDSTWLLYNLGRPGKVMRLGWIGGQVWSWRYPTFDCLWFQVTVNDDGSLRDAGVTASTRAATHPKGRGRAGERTESFSTACRACPRPSTPRGDLFGCDSLAIEGTRCQRPSK